ncbi:MAG: hypothetical protein KC422_16510 [Trueperaceae bacterium]|nr:hypothetical protein [Trueperaceae bacterium]
MSTSKPLEIAIRKVKAGQEKAFVQARASFINKLKKQESVERDWEFKSFFSMPDKDDTDVFIGMTRYVSMDAVSQISSSLMDTDIAQSFFTTFDMKAFVLVNSADGDDFRLEDIISSPEHVLEVAVRTPKEGFEDQFDGLRKGFFDLVAAQPGYIMDKEFIDVQTGARVVLIAWKSQDAFQNALGVLSVKAEMGAFFAAIEASAYQAMKPIDNS